jgi:hypothetical protein
MCDLGMLAPILMRGSLMRAYLIPDARHKYSVVTATEYKATLSASIFFLVLVIGPYYLVLRAFGFTGANPSSSISTVGLSGADSPSCRCGPVGTCDFFACPKSG